MPDKRTTAADTTAAQVALSRAMHVQVDPPPHVFEDEIGLRLAAPRGRTEAMQPEELMAGAEGSRPRPQRG